MKLSTFLKNNNCYDEFVENFDTEYSECWLDYNAYIIGLAFDWEESPEGYDYWDDIDNIWDIIKNKENDMKWILENKDK